MTRRIKMERLNIGRRPRSGDPCACAKCRGLLQVANTKVKEAEGCRIQYLACNLCAWRPDDNKIVIPLQYAPPRLQKE